MLNPNAKMIARFSGYFYGIKIQDLLATPGLCSLTQGMNRQTMPKNKAKPAAQAKLLRARSLPSSWPFAVAAFFSALHYLGIIAALTGVVLFGIEQSHLAVRVILGGIGFSVVTGFIAFFKRRAAHCPLCKGTPLINSGARAHSRATRIPPFNRGVSATLSVIACQNFRCMYCGSDFDLLKTPSHRRKNEGDKE